MERRRDGLAEGWTGGGMDRRRDGQAEGWKGGGWTAGGLDRGKGVKKNKKIGGSLAQDTFSSYI